MSFKDKVITLTGAASGMGLCTARILAPQGALLSLADYNASALQTAHSELSKLAPNPENIMSTVVDIRDTAAVDSWIAKTVSHFKKPISGAANIAGFHPLWTPRNISDISDDDFEQVQAINSTGLFKCLRAQLREDIMPTNSSIVNVGSVSGLVGFAGDAAYVASKHAAHGLTKCASKEGGKRGIRVNAVAPGQTMTPMVTNMFKTTNERLALPNVTLGRSAEPEEIAKMIVWLLGDESSYVTGAVYRVDGGMLDY